MSRYNLFVRNKRAFLDVSRSMGRLVDKVLVSGTVIFMFHRVLAQSADSFHPELCTSVDLFSEFLDWVKEKYRIASLEEIVGRKRRPVQSRRPECVITFDDGWYDNFTHAFPQLQSRGIPATIFLPARFIGTNRRFWQEHLWLYLRASKDPDCNRHVLGKVAATFPWFPPIEQDFMSYAYLRRLLMTRPSTEAEEFVQRLLDFSGLADAFPGRSFMTWEEVTQMQGAGISFGSHTLNHTLLSAAPPKTAVIEIRQSREELKARIGGNVAGFAYPWGAVSRNSLELVRSSGYKFAATVGPGVIVGTTNPFLLPRLAVSDSVLRGHHESLDRAQARIYFTKQLFLASIKRLTRKKTKTINKRIKIIFVLDVITEWEGGTERQLRLLIGSLDLDHFEPKLCFLTTSPSIAQTTLPCPLRMASPTSGARTSAAKRLWNLCRILREENPDIVQCFFVEGLMTGILAGRLMNIPRVVGSVRNNGYWRKIRHRLIFKIINPLAHRWQTNSRAMFRFQNKVESTPQHKIEILPNGMDLSTFVAPTSLAREKARHNLGLINDEVVCVSVANLSPVKDIKTLIVGAAALRKRLPKLQVLLVGEGAERDVLESLVGRMGLAGTVRFVGRQPDVYPFLAAADIGVLTSRSEGSSNSVLEYMAMGLPAVVSDIAANRELLDEVLFQTGNPEDLAEKLYQLWTDVEGRARLSLEYAVRAREYNLESFSIRAQSFYNRMASQNEIV